ncbi:MAG: nucleotide exchange factor GrpE [Marinifilaceae bacterium]
MSEEIKDQLDQEELKEEATDETTEEVVAEEVVEEESNEVDSLKEQLAVIADKYLRLQAEFDNYRKRTLKEKMELTKTAGEKVIVELLPVVDNFERALATMEKATDVDAVRQGVELIYNGLRDTLARQGVKTIDCVNTEFNVDEQEAITKIPAPTPEMKGKVVDCVEKGYILNDKVIRYAKVVVGE